MPGPAASPLIFGGGGGRRRGRVSRGLAILAVVGVAGGMASGRALEYGIPRAWLGDLTATSAAAAGLPVFAVDRGGVARWTAWPSPNCPPAASSLKPGDSLSLPLPRLFPERMVPSGVAGAPESFFSPPARGLPGRFPPPPALEAGDSARRVPEWRIPPGEPGRTLSRGPAVDGGAAFLKEQAALGERRLSRILTDELPPERASREDAAVALSFCGDLIAAAPTRSGVESWATRAWGYWRRVHGAPGSADAAAGGDFGAWLALRPAADFPPARRRFFLARLAAESDDQETVSVHRAVLEELSADPAAAEFHDEILLSLGVIGIRRELPDADRPLRRLLAEYPHSPAVSRALFLLAWVDLMDGREEEAAGYLRTLLADHPQDPLAGRAREMLAALTAPESADAEPAPRGGEFRNPEVEVF